MKLIKKIKRRLNQKVVALVLLIVFLCTVFGLFTRYVYTKSDEQGGHSMSRGMIFEMEQDEDSEYAEDIKRVTFIVGAVMIGALLIYLIAVFIDDRAVLKRNREIYKVQKLLLENDKTEYENALKQLAKKCKGSFSFIYYLSDNGYHFLAAEPNGKMTWIPDMDEKLVTEFLNLVEDGSEACLIKEKELEPASYAEIIRYMQKNNIQSFELASTISSQNKHEEIVGVANPGDVPMARTLLTSLVFCFSLAMTNLRYTRKIQKERLTDTLTGLANRTAYHERLKKITTDKPVSFVCVYADVNELHMTNNLYGHEAGDKMLKTVGNALVEHFGIENAYRIGGDEFVAILTNTEETESAEKARLAVADAAAAGYHVSYGVEYASGEYDINDCIKRAEGKMYNDKYLYYQAKASKSEQTLKTSGSNYYTNSMPEDVQCFMNIAEQDIHGVFAVNLETDNTRELFVNDYFNKLLKENSYKFSDAFKHYISESINDDSRREVESFTDYKKIRTEISSGVIPKVEYHLSNGDSICLTVHSAATQDINDTMWIFMIEREK